MTDFRALCAELHAAFNTYAVNEAHHDLLVRTKDALAQPEPQTIPKNCWLVDEPYVCPSPCVPPPELIEQWYEEAAHRQYCAIETENHLIEMVAQWAADQELEACVEWLSKQSKIWTSNQLRAARRPKPLSLKEQSIALIDLIQGSKKVWAISDLDVIRKALEQLND